MAINKSMIKVLVISNCPLNTDQGSGYVILGFSLEMMKRGHSVKVFGPENYLFLPFLEPAKRLRLFIGYTLKALKEALFSGSTYDVVELWGATGWLSIIILRLARSSKLLIVSRSNGLEPHFRQRSRRLAPFSRLRRFFSFIESRFDEIGYRCANALTVVSSFDEIFAIKHRYMIRDRLLMIENPLPSHWLNRIVSSISELPVIGFVGSWNSNKGSDLLIEIINLVCQSQPHVKWIIAGVGSKGKQQISSQTPISSESIYESASKSQLEALYSRMTILLCLSNYESFGLVCAEAMSFGCALVSTKVGFMAGLKDGEEYVSIDRLDPVGIASLLVSLANNPKDCLNIAGNGYKRVQCLNWEVAADRLESFYRNLLGHAVA